MNVMPSYVHSGGPPLFLDQNEKKKFSRPSSPPPPFSQGLDLSLVHTVKMKESGRKIEPKEIPSCLIPLAYLIGTYFCKSLISHFLWFKKNRQFIKDPRLKILAKFKQTRFQTHIENSNHGKKDSHDKYWQIDLSLSRTSFRDFLWTLIHVLNWIELNWIELNWIGVLF